MLNRTSTLLTRLPTDLVPDNARAAGSNARSVYNCMTHPNAMVTTTVPAAGCHGSPLREADAPGLSRSERFRITKQVFFPSWEED